MPPGLEGDGRRASLPLISVSHLSQKPQSQGFDAPEVDDEEDAEDVAKQLVSRTFEGKIHLKQLKKLKTFFDNSANCGGCVCSGTLVRGGGLACRHGVLFSSTASGAYWPIAIRCPSLALCPSSSSLPNHSLSTSLSFPLVSCANGAPGLSLFHFSVSCWGWASDAKPEPGFVVQVSPGSEQWRAM